MATRSATPTTSSAASTRVRGAALTDLTVSELKAVKFKDTAEQMMSLRDLLDRVAGRTGLVVEIKSHYDGDRRIVQRTAELLLAYSGPAVAMHR